MDATQTGLMELVLESVARNRPGGGSECRRLATRFGIGGTIDLVPLGVKPRLFAEPACVRDVSAQGIGLVSKTEMCPGTRFVLKLPARNRCQPAGAVICEALHSRPLEGGSYRIGARFLARAA